MAYPKVLKKKLAPGAEFLKKHSRKCGVWLKKISRIQQTTEPEESEISGTELDLQYQELKKNENKILQLHTIFILERSWNSWKMN